MPHHLPLLLLLLLGTTSAIPVDLLQAKRDNLRRATQLARSSSSSSSAPLSSSSTRLEESLRTQQQEAEAFRHASTLPNFPPGSAAEHGQPFPVGVSGKLNHPQVHIETLPVGLRRPPVPSAPPPVPVDGNSETVSALQRPEEEGNDSIMSSQDKQDDSSSRSSGSPQVVPVSFVRFPVRRGRRVDDAELEFQVLQRSTKQGQVFTAYVGVVGNPMHHFAYLPSRKSSVESHFKGITSYQCVEELPEDMAGPANCTLATNAGFFNMDNGQCIGNFISNGTALQIDHTERAVFGITKRGEYVAGYLTNDNVMQLDFLELLSGRGWLVKSGASVVNASIIAENIDNTFETEKAPRTGIGHDRDGRLIIVQVDGEEDVKKGLDLHEFADLFMYLGALNAVNLDGGGSSVTLYKGKLVSKPTCADTSRICERKIPSIVCVR